MTSSMHGYDVGVVGAGPAGSWVARQLAVAGARVAIFDASHPREKPCGGGVTRRAFELVAPAMVRPTPTVTIDTVVFESDDGLRTSIPLDGRPPGGPAAASQLTVVPRSAFDAALLESATGAGATWVAERVREVDFGTAGASLTTTRGRYRCAWLVGADGATSLVRRRASRPFARAQLSVATGFYARGVTSREIVLSFVSDPPGYIWSFPRADHLAVGICAQADVADSARLRSRLAAWLEQNGVAARASLRPYAWPIPSLGAGDFVSEAVAGSRWLLVGDAAGLVDPITREGIFFALESAAHAAAALAGERPDTEYTRHIREGTARELEVAARIKRTFFRPEFIRLMVAGLARSGALRGVMADLIAGTQPYTNLGRRLLGTLELGLAWKVLWLRHGWR